MTKIACRFFCERLSAAPAHLPGDIPLLVAFSNRIAFVVLPLTDGDAEFALGPAAFEVDRQWYHRLALLSDVGGDQFYLPAMQKQLAITGGVVLDRPGSIGIHGDVGTDQKNLIADEPGVSFIEPRMACADGLDLSAQQFDTSFDHLEDFVVVASLAVGNPRGLVGGFLLFLGHVLN